MSATTALRSQYYDKEHKAIKEKLSLKAERFRADHGYAAPYWELVKLSRTAKDEVEKGR